MLKKLFAIILHRSKRPLSKEHQLYQKLRECWKYVASHRMPYLPLPLGEVEPLITIKEIKGLSKELDGIHKRLSMLEDRTLYKSYPLENQEVSDHP